MKPFTLSELPSEIPEFQKFLDTCVNKNSATPHRHLGCVQGTHRVPSHLKLQNVMRIDAPQVKGRYLTALQELQSSPVGPLELNGVSLMTMTHAPHIVEFETVEKSVNEVFLILPGSQQVLEDFCNRARGLHKVSNRSESPEVNARFARRSSKDDVQYDIVGPGTYFCDLVSFANTCIPCPGCGQDCVEVPLQCTCTPTNAPKSYGLTICRVLLGKTYVEEDCLNNTTDVRAYQYSLREQGYHSIMVEADRLVGPGMRSLDFRQWCVLDEKRVLPVYYLEYDRCL